ncbi:hypothetical protein LA76x_3778 [Lysobacter antibioticus]|uniref:Uncharacterized protein n=1 Tax=Lysobacter antibioticus TaxID=84531 RepID=A0A0S2FEE8_LYSAN|nr:hypothetical protein LA76x_3778 [Lysobacter antibioticus]
MGRCGLGLLGGGAAGEEAAGDPQRAVDGAEQAGTAEGTERTAAGLRHSEDPWRGGLGIPLA